MSLARRIAAAITPDAVKRRHERWATGRYMAAISEPTEEYLRRYGSTVRHGPFAGMDYLAQGQSWSNDVVAKLVGSYERELHGVIEAWATARPEHVVDVGCAEGYYAVGLARLLPDTRVRAQDIDPLARERTAALAARNGVADRVAVGGECTPATLATLPATGVALLADCEGYERVLLDPAAAPNLAGWEILVELHDFIEPGVTETIVERFAATHDVTLIEDEPRDGTGIDELAFLDAGTRALVLNERRPARMRWAAMRPRGRS
jgi:hypothetical protein